MMHGWGFGGGGYPHHTQRFEEQYHCYSVSVADKSHLEKGDKILLPPSAFDTLARLQVDYPMLFRLTSTPAHATGSSTPVTEKFTHCGVLEFTAEEGTCYIPFWMMQNLLISEGAVLTVTNVSLPKASFVKLQPQSTDFLEISNPRAVLEHALRNFSCVTKGDIIQIPYNNKNFQFELKEVKPQDAACIIETDCNVDFDAPVGYQEPNYSKQSSGVSSAASSSMCPSPSVSSTGVASSLGEAAAAAAALSNGVMNGSSHSNGVAAKSQQSQMEDTEDEETIPAVRVVDGNIIRNEDTSANAMASKPITKSLAERTGATGVQKNAAIPEMAPEIDYWVLSAGSGARLDGKKPAQLKDKDGNIVNEQEIRDRRAAALKAAERRAAAAAATPKSSTPSSGTTTTPSSSSSAPVSKRKTRVGSKYSRLKQTGMPFKGNANSLT